MTVCVCVVMAAWFILSAMIAHAPHVQPRSLAPLGSGQVRL